MVTDGRRAARPGAEVEVEVEVEGLAARGRAPDLRVVVGMLTYLRTTELPEAVESVLAAMDELVGTAGAALEVELLVVDNDPGGGAMGLATRWPDVRFVHEPTPGIAAARNRVLDETTGADLVVFVDDDERPRPGWLPALVGVWRATGADAVVGPVVSAFAVEPGRWIEEGGFFRRRRMATGTEVSVAATNNLLLDRARVDALGLRFDPAFGASGGSDTLFTRQMHRRGGRMVWCDEAVVTDVVPAQRATRSWVLRRALRSGNSWARVALALEEHLSRRLAQRVRLSGSGLARVVGGGARLTAGVLTGSVRQRASGAKTLARGLGMVGGAWGYTYAEYRRGGRASRR